MDGTTSTESLDLSSRPARLTVRLLGLPQAWVGDEPVLELQVTKVMALLAYLAVEHSQGHTRGALAALFWPDVLEPKAHQNLRQLLLRLRTSIGDYQAHPPHLLVDSQAIRFNGQSHFWLDVLAFKGLVEGTQRHQHRRLSACGTCLSRLAEAVCLYRGEFLDGLRLEASWAFEEWLVMQREELQELAVRSLDALAAAHLARGESESACRYARQLLSLDPWNEAAQRVLLRGLLPSRGRNAALRQYSAFRRALIAELGVEPEDETQALAVKIRAGTWTEQGPLTLGAVPVPLTPFVGREQELAQISDRLEGRESRLLTVCGQGGTGKTRLALEIADRQAGLWQDGVWFLPLAEEVRTQQDLVEALASVLASRSGRAARPLDTKALVEAFSSREMLLVLDGFEHLAGEPSLLLDLLHRAPGVRLLVTSRARLRVRQEWVLPLGGLDLPAVGMASTAGAESLSAVQLFVASARRAVPDFCLTADNLPAVIRICHLVDGLPLGIALAAAWVRLLPVDQIAAEIERSPELIRAPGSASPQGQHSLRGTFDYSYRLLTESERALFRSLSVFRGGFTTQAACQVTGAALPDVASLHDASLLHALPTGRLDLHLSLREYAAGELAARPELQRAAQERHSQFFLDLLREKQATLLGDLSREAAEEIDLEVDNVRAAWQWAVDEARLDELDASLEPLSLLYGSRGLFQQALDAFAAASERVLALADRAAAARRLAGRLLAEQASYLRNRGSYSEAIEVARTALGLAQASQDRRSEAKALFVRGEVAWRQGEFEPARRDLERALALARETPDRQLEIDCLRSLAGVCWRKGDYAGAGAHLEDALQLALREGNKRQQGILLCNLGVVAVEQADLPAAAGYYERALQLDRETGDRDAEGVAVTNLGNLMLYLGAYAEAERHYREALKTHQETGARHSEAWTLGNLGLLAHYQGRDGAALAFCREAVRSAQQIGDPAMQAAVWMDLGHALLGSGQLEKAGAAYGEALALRRAGSQANLLTEPLAGLAEVALAQGDDAQAQAHVEEILHHLEGGDKALDGTINPFEIWLTCYHVLLHDGDRRAGQVLSAAYERLQERAGRIADVEMRCSFLENVAAHRGIVEAWEPTKKGCPISGQPLSDV
jgi:predicted ATPase/DNA-binding SARP family transcriptional activator/Tfp pilus assembly protein PilF